MSPKVKLLFTRAPKPLSRLICWGLREPVSHVALQIGPLVLHAHGGGVDLDYITTFTRRYQIVQQLEVPESVAITLEAAASYEAVQYDTLALLYLAVRAVGWRWLRLPRPKHNRWARTGHFTCVEYVTYLLTGQENSTYSPHELYLQLRQHWG